MISPATINANVDVANFDGTSSTNAGGPITGWSIDSGGSTVPTSLEGDLQIPWPPTGNICGMAVACGSTSLTLSYGPFANPGIYRVQLTSMDVSGFTETSTEYFVVSP